MHPLAALAVGLGIAVLPGTADPGPEIGKPAPAFTMVDAQGKTHSLSDYKGKLVVLEWVNIACPEAYNNYASGLVPKLQKKYQAKDVVWLSVIMTEKQQGSYGTITQESAQSIAADMAEMYAASPKATLIDVGRTVGAAYDVRTSMHTFVIDQQGVLVYDGALNERSNGEGENYVVSALDATIAGKPVATAKTMPYGCHPIDGVPVDSVPVDGNGK